MATDETTTKVVDEENDATPPPADVAKGDATENGDAAKGDSTEETPNEGSSKDQLARCDQPAETYKEKSVLTKFVHKLLEAAYPCQSDRYHAKDDAVANTLSSHKSSQDCKYVASELTEPFSSYYISSSYNSFLPFPTAIATIASSAAIEKALSRGARAIHLVVCERKRDPVVCIGIGSMRLRLNKAVSFTECLQVIASCGWKTDTTPLFLFLELRDLVLETENKVAAAIKAELNDYLDERTIDLNVDCPAGFQEKCIVSCLGGCSTGSEFSRLVNFDICSNESVFKTVPASAMACDSCHKKNDFIEFMANQGNLFVYPPTDMLVLKNYKIETMMQSGLGPFLTYNFQRNDQRMNEYLRFFRKSAGYVVKKDWRHNLHLNKMNTNWTLNGAVVETKEKVVGKVEAASGVPQKVVAGAFM